MEKSSSFTFCPRCGGNADICRCNAIFPPRQIPGDATANFPRSSEQAETLRIEGAKAWEKIHRYEGNDPLWVEEWIENEVPKYCDCGENLKAILERVPFDYSSPEAFFISTVLVHNAVNSKLGNSLMTLEEAYDRWGRFRSLYKNQEGE